MRDRPDDALIDRGRDRAEPSRCTALAAPTRGPSSPRWPAHPAASPPACHRQVDGALMDKPPEARDHRQFRRRLRHRRRKEAAAARHRRHQHARRADRGGGRSPRSGSCSRRCASCPRSTATSGPANGSSGPIRSPRRCAAARSASGPRAASARRSRASRGLRPRDRLSRPQPAVRRVVPVLSDAARDGEGRRRAHVRGAGRRGDPAHRQCRGPARRSGPTAC